jgi:hypothetical protein
MIVKGEHTSWKESKDGGLMMSTTVIRFSETWFSAKKRNSLSSRRVRRANTIGEVIESGPGQHAQSRRTGAYSNGRMGQSS